MTSVSRTLVELAGEVDRRRLRRLVDLADRLHLLNLDAVERACSRAAGRPGVRSLSSLIAEQRPPPYTRSELEDRFLDLCRESGLALPATNVMVGRIEVDFLWRDAHLVVELDGYELHRTRAAFERDRARDAELKLAGYEVVRITWRRLRDHPEAAANLIRWLIARGGPT